MIESRQLGRSREFGEQFDGFMQDLNDEAINFPISPFRHSLSYTSLLGNLLSIMDTPYSPEVFPKVKGITPFDLYSLERFCVRHKAKVVTEFGVGSTTKFLRSQGIEVRSFSIGLPGDIEENIEYVRCDLMDPLFLGEILQSCLTSDLVLIDCLHSYNMAKYYCEEILRFTKLPLFIHDWWNPARGIVYGEQAYLWDHFVDTTHKIFSFTDLPRNCVASLSSLTGKDLEIERYPDQWPPVYRDRPSMCALFMEPI
jgi:hypothetical protein